MNTQKKELNTMNAIACLLVILIHVLSFAISQLKPDSWQLLTIYFPWKAAGFVVPMFLYTGAVKVALSFSDRSLTVGGYGRYVLKRFQKIYLPYVLWVGIYYICFLVIGYVKGDWSEFFQYLFIGNLSSPFYYVIVVMQFYLLLPLWTWMLKDVPTYAGIAVAALVTILSRQLPDTLAAFGLNFAYTDRIFPAYIVFWVLGLYAGKHYDSLAMMLRKRSGLWLSFGVVLFFVTMAYLQHRSGTYFLNMENIKIVNDILSIALIQAFALKLNCLKGKVRNVMDGIYESSFSVYLSHCLFLTLFTYFLGRLGVTGVLPMLAGRFVVGYTLPFLLYRMKTAAQGLLSSGENVDKGTRR